MQCLQYHRYHFLFTLTYCYYLLYITGVWGIVWGRMWGKNSIWETVNMAAKKRFKTDYPGVFYIEGQTDTGKPEKIYYIRYRKNGKLTEEKAGRQYKNNMTPAKARDMRSDRARGKELSNQEKREEKSAEKKRMTIGRLWGIYSNQLPGGPNRTDKSLWNAHLEKPFGDKEPGQLVKLDTDRLRINLLKKKSPQLVKHALALLRRIINYGVNHGMIAPLPFKITLPHVDNQKTEDLTPEQFQRLLEVLDSTDLTAVARMMKLVIYTGMRRGEVFKLRWADVDFHREFIHIVEPKGGKSQKIPLNASARQLLESIPETEGSDYIFPSRAGGPRRDIAKDARKIKEAAGLPADFRPFHGLRHHFASMLASSGQVDMYTLQKLLTHKSPQMTQRYAHLRDDALQRAAAQVDDIIGDAINTKVNEKKAAS